MEIIENWTQIKALFKQSFLSSFHFSIASVNEHGEPHLTPIGSLMLGQPGCGIYFEKFTRRLPKHYHNNKNICVLAVNSSKWFWLKSILMGRFKHPPALRLYGVVGELRDANDKEIRRWRNAVKPFRFTKGYALMWKSMSKVRDVQFTRIEPVKIGKMTTDI